MNNTYISPSALVEANVSIGESTKIWHNSHIRNDANIGSGCVIGENVYVGVKVRIGNNSKIQNGAQIYEPADLGNGVFIGPQVVLTNDRIPRSIAPNGTLKSSKDWDLVGVSVNDGASIGANSTCIAPVRIGKWALVGAGSVVTKDVPDYALVVGNPARQIAWVSEAGQTLVDEGGNEFRCPVTNARYRLENGCIKKLD